ncbi:MAG: osmotically-inducible protein OsmY, partial [Paracoccaceae bacterium]
MTQEKQLSSVRVLAVLVGLSVLSACSAQGTVIGLGAVVGRILLQERDAGDALSDTDIEIGILTRILEFSPEAAATVSVTSIEGRVLLTGDVDGAEDVARIV